jgi:hypothetical protein
MAFGSLRLFSGMQVTGNCFLPKRSANASASSGLEHYEVSVIGAQGVR